jgi:hypothetical protein
MIENLINNFETQHNISRTQINLIFLFMFLSIIQGLYFYYNSPQKFNIKFFILLLIFGFFFNVFYCKLYLE